MAEQDVTIPAGQVLRTEPAHKPMKLFLCVVAQKDERSGESTDFLTGAEHIKAPDSQRARNMMVLKHSELMKKNPLAVIRATLLFNGADPSEEI